MLQQVTLIQEHTGISRIIFIFDNISVSLKSFPNNRFLKFRFTFKKKKIKSCKLHPRDLGCRVLKSYPYDRWYRLISTVLLSFSLTSPMSKLYKILRLFSSFEKRERAKQTGQIEVERKRKK